MDTGKTYDKAVLAAINRSEFKNLSAECIENIAMFAVEYAEEGYGIGWNEAMESVRRTDNVSFAKEIRIKFPDDFSFGNKNAAEDFERVADEIQEIIKRYDDKYFMFNQD